MKKFFLGLGFVVVVSVAGLVYRNAAEHPSQPIACPMDAEICPDGTSVARVGNSCTFSACPFPNVSLPDVGIAFAVPAGFASANPPDAASIASYTTSATTSTTIVIRRYTVAASSTPLETVRETAIANASGMPVSVTALTSITFGEYHFTQVSIERFEGVIDTAYYLPREKDVLRFDAIDTSTDWTNPNLDVSTLPAHAALAKLLTSLQGNK